MLAHRKLVVEVEKRLGRTAGVVASLRRVGEAQPDRRPFVAARRRFAFEQILVDVGRRVVIAHLLRGLGFAKSRSLAHETFGALQRSKALAGGLESAQPELGDAGVVRRVRLQSGSCGCCCRETRQRLLVPLVGVHPKRSLKVNIGRVCGRGIAIGGRSGHPQLSRLACNGWMRGWRERRQRDIGGPLGKWTRRLKHHQHHDGTREDQRVSSP